MAKVPVNGIEIDYEDTGRGRPILLDFLDTLPGGR
jgi:hypothetical protein